MYSIIVGAERSDTGLSKPDGRPITLDDLALSDRLLAALADWVAFFDDADGAIDDEVSINEFVSQGFKIAHGIRRELKGSQVWLSHPDTGDLVPIELHRLA